MGGIKVDGRVVKPTVYNEVSAAFEKLDREQNRNDKVAGALYELYLKTRDDRHYIMDSFRGPLKGFLELGDIKQDYQTILQGCLVFRSPSGELVARSVEEMKDLQAPRDGYVVWSEEKVKRN